MTIDAHLLVYLLGAIFVLAVMLAGKPFKEMATGGQEVPAFFSCLFGGMVWPLTPLVVFLHSAAFGDDS
jgi:hypothetical protein